MFHVKHCSRCGSTDTTPYTAKPPRKHPNKRIPCDADCTVTGVFCRQCRTFSHGK